MPKLTVRNSTGYVTADLERFFARGLQALGATGDKIIKVISTKTDDGRGIAFVGRCAYPRERGHARARVWFSCCRTPEPAHTSPTRTPVRARAEAQPRAVARADERG